MYPFFTYMHKRNIATVTYILKFISISFLNPYTLYFYKSCAFTYLPQRLSCVLLTNYVPKCQMSSGPYGPILFLTGKPPYASHAETSLTNFRLLDSFGLFDFSISDSHWQIQGAPPDPPQWDPILSFPHTFLPKSTSIGGRRPPQTAQCPPTGNPGSATGFLIIFYIIHIITGEGKIFN